MRYRKNVTAAVVLFLLLLACSGCQTMASVRGSSQDFVAAATTLTQAEAEYFDEIQAASDSGHRLRFASNYICRNGNFGDIVGELTKKDDFSKAKQARLNVMKQLQNYAEVISAITAGADARWIASDASKLTKESSTLLKDLGGKQLSTSQQGTIQTAVADLGKAIIDAATARKLHLLAEEARAPIDLIVNMVAQDEQNIETDNFAAGLVADQTNELKNGLHCLYDDATVNSAQRFSAVFVVANWKPSLVTKGTAIKAAVVKLKEANDAMAKKEDNSAISLIKQASALASSATAKPTTAR